MTLNMFKNGCKYTVRTAVIVIMFPIFIITIINVVKVSRRYSMQVQENMLYSITDTKSKVI